MVDIFFLRIRHTLYFLSWNQIVSILDLRNIKDIYWDVVGAIVRNPFFTEDFDTEYHLHKTK